MSLLREQRTFFLDYLRALLVIDLLLYGVPDLFSFLELQLLLHIVQIPGSLDDLRFLLHLGE